MKIKEIKKMRFELKVSVDTLIDEATDKVISANELLIHKIREDIVEYQQQHNFLIDIDSEIKINFYGNDGLSEYTCSLNAIEVINNININKIG
jgi:hypothetical protein